MRLFITCFVVALGAVLVGLIAMFLTMWLGVVPAFVAGAAVAGMVGYVVLHGRVLGRAHASVVAAAAAGALVAAPFATLAGLSWREHRENVYEARSLCQAHSEIRARFASLDSCVEAHAAALDRRD